MSPRSTTTHAVSDEPSLRERDAARACREVLEHHAKSFALAARLLAPERRDDAAVLYAWCRRVDDAVDEVPPTQARVALRTLHAELDALYDGVGAAHRDAGEQSRDGLGPDAAGPEASTDAALDPALLREAMRVVVTRRRIPRLYLDELLAGMAMDVDAATNEVSPRSSERSEHSELGERSERSERSELGEHSELSELGERSELGDESSRGPMQAGMRYDTLEDLLRYAHRVAGVVGLMMCHVLGVRDDDALVPAAHLGWAMQLTNIARDVKEDWERGRLYLPREWLVVPSSERATEGARSKPPDIEVRGPFPDSLASTTADAVARLLAVADHYYASADRGLIALSLRDAAAIATARHVYAAIGGVISARGHDVRRGRAVVPGPGKAREVARALAETARSLPRRAVARLEGAGVGIPRRTVRFEELVLR